MNTTILISTARLSALGSMGALLSAACVAQTEGAPLPEQGELYALARSIDTPDGRSTFVEIAPSLDGRFAGASGLEFGGTPVVFAPPEPDGRLFIASRDEPVVLRFEVQEGALVETGRLGFAGLGVSFFEGFSGHLIVSPTKAYYFELSAERVIVWNPTTMEITGMLEAAGTTRDGLATDYVAPLLHAGTAIVPFHFYSADYADVAPESGVLLVDAETDALRVDVDERCPAIGRPTLGADGNIYFGSIPVAAIQQGTTQPDISASCALRRLLPGAEGFDRAFRLDLQALTGAPTGLIVGSSSGFFAKVLNAQRAGGLPANADDWYTSVWDWWHIDPAAAAAERVEAIGPTSARAIFHDVGGRTLIDEFDEVANEAVLWDVTDAAEPRPAARLQGYVYGIARLR